MAVSSLNERWTDVETKYSFLYSIYHAIIGLIVPRPKEEKVEVAQRHTQISTIRNVKTNLKENKYE